MEKLEIEPATPGLQDIGLSPTPCPPFGYAHKLSEQQMLIKHIYSKYKPLIKVRNFYFYFLTKTYAVGTQKNRLNETVLLITKNKCYD